MRAKLFLTWLSITFALAAFGQITGNIKLINVYGDTLTDHSGTKVYFEPRSGSAVLDSTTTDINGDFSLSPAAGSYLIVARHPGYIALSHGSSSAGWISTPNDIVPNKVMYQHRPWVYVPPGNVSGNWTGDTIYILTGQTTIAAGDTLSVTNGAIVSGIDLISMPLLGGELIIDGHLNVIGNDTAHTIMASLDSANNVFNAGGMFISVNSGGSLYLENADLPDVEMTVNDGDLVFDKYNYKEIPFLDQMPLQASPFIMGDQASIYIVDSDFFGIYQLDFQSKLIIDCSIVNGSIEVNNDATFKITGSLVRSLTTCNNCDTIIAKDNLYIGSISNQMYTNNTGTDPSYISMQNCFGYAGPYIDISGDIDLDFVNNGIQCDNCLTIDPNVNTLRFDYNLLISSNPIQAPIYIAGGGAPLWILNGWSSTTSVDTIDSHGNRYFDGNQTISPWLETYPPDFEMLIGPGYNLYCIDKGDPNIQDPDGSRSDIGARDIYNCPVSIISGQTPIPTVADSVFPGDANHDGIANNFDILPIGIKYLQTGPVRPNASNNWVPQDCPDWNDSLANHVNIKHVDCNGDGEINSPDINAVYINYGLTHNNPKRSFGEGLWLQFPSDSIFEGDTIEIGVMAGRSQSPVNNVYGMAFSILADPAFVVTGSGSMKFDPCWVGTDSVNIISFFREDTLSHKYDVALVRTDGQNVSGYGQIGTLSVVMNDDIQAKNEITLTTQMGFADVLAINYQEIDLQLGGEAGTFNVLAGYERASGIKTLPTDWLIKTYPNPANNILYIQNQSNISYNYQLLNLSGMEILSGSAEAGLNMIDVSALKQGLYFLKLNNQGQTFIKKVSITNVE